MVAVPRSTPDANPNSTFRPDGLVVLSATYRERGTEEREALAEALLQRKGFVEQVSLHTCHRIELIAVLAHGELPPAHPGLGLARGAEAAERVFLVAGGLDSAVVAEEQVLGQVREAYEGARAAGATGPVLNELLQRAIRFGKRVRSEVQPRTDRGLADRALGWAAQRLDPGAGRAALVIGTGEMGGLVAASLAARGMTVTVGSRSVERAERVVAGLPNSDHHRAVSLERGLRQAANQDVVAIAVRSATNLLDASHLLSGRLPLVIDLSAPPAVTRAAADLLGDRLLDLDRLGAPSSTHRLSYAAEHRLRAAASGEARGFVTWWAQRSSGDGIATLHAHADEIRERHLERLRRRADLTPEQLTAVEATAAAMLGELLHAPTLRLQREPAARDVVARVFGLDA